MYVMDIIPWLALIYDLDPEDWREEPHHLPFLAN